LITVLSSKDSLTGAMIRYADENPCPQGIVAASTGRTRRQFPVPF